MNAEKMWEMFGGRRSEFSSFAFGDDTDGLARLVYEGKKTATSSAAPLYELEGVPLPKRGECSVVLDSAGDAVCIIETTRVYVVPFSEVGAEHARMEGEGDLSLEYWRRVHREFFSECMAEAGLEFDEGMPVVCEEFEVVYR